MASSETKSSGSYAIPLLLALTLTAGGTALYFSSLNSSRPASDSELSLPNAGTQDVPARLWQDPFAAIERTLTAARHARTEQETAGGVLAGDDSKSHLIDCLRAQIKWHLDRNASKSDEVLVLPVMVSTKSYAEVGERRLRTRVAVLEALAVRGFEPENGDGLGYVTLGRFGQEQSGSSGNVTQECEDATTQPANDRSVYVPYEWFKPARSVEGWRSKDPVRAILVLWVSEEPFAHDHPVARMQSLRERICGDRRNAVSWNVVGPFSSDGLVAMVDEGESNLRGPPHSEVDISYFDANSTAANELLLYAKSTTRGETQVSSFLKRTTGATLYRTTSDDVELCRTLLDELELRGIHARSKSRNASGQVPDDERDVDQIALITEWDTFYGRAIALTFAAEARPYSDSVSQLIGGGSFPSWVNRFEYLRGIDGKLPQDQSRAARPAPEDSSREAQHYSKFGPPAEAVEGTNQSDYLRRLSNQLADLDASIRQKDPTGRKRLKAVGVLGTDVYDKLLILRALRDRLPDVVFFTTGVDARYLHPDERTGTHGLIIAAAFGERLHRYYQKGIPPFRDSDQTATFAATLCALGQIDLPSMGEPFVPPRTFVVGRTGLHDLSNDAQSPADAESERYSARKEPAAGDNKPPNVHPPRYNLAVWPTKGEVWWSAIGLCVVLVALALLLGVRPDDVRLPVLLTTTPAWIVGAVLIVVAVMCAARLVSGPTDEPWAFAEGISVWPSEAIRLFTLILCIHFVIKTFVLFRGVDERIENDFNLQPLTIRPGAGFRRAKMLVKGRFHRWASWWGVLRSTLHAWSLRNDAADENEARAKVRESILHLARRAFPRRPPPVVVGPPLSCNESPCLTLRRWPVFGDRRGRQVTWRRLESAFPFPTGTPTVYAQNLWWEHQRRAYWPVRLLRSLTLAAVFYFFCSAVLKIYGYPPSPARGYLARGFVEKLSLLNILMFVFLTFLVLDVTYLHKRFINYLVERDTTYPAGAAKNWLDPLNESDRIEYLDIRLIATLTESVGDVAYFPFVIFFLLLISRLSIFAQWKWTIGLVLVLGINFALTLIAAVMLRRAAEDARGEALSRMRLRLIAHSALAGHEEQCRALSLMIKEVEEQSSGAFSILSRHPIIATILLPSGSIGIWAILEYIPKVLS